MQDSWKACVQGSECGVRLPAPAPAPSAAPNSAQQICAASDSVSDQSRFQCLDHNQLLTPVQPTLLEELATDCVLECQISAEMWNVVFKAGLTYHPQIQQQRNN